MYWVSAHQSTMLSQPAHALSSAFVYPSLLMGNVWPPRVSIVKMILVQWLPPSIYVACTKWPAVVIDFQEFFYIAELPTCVNISFVTRSGPGDVLFLILADHVTHVIRCHFLSLPLSLFLSYFFWYFILTVMLLTSS